MRALLTVCTPEMYHLICMHMPAGVAVAAKEELIDKPVVVLRLVGGGLPDWAEIKGGMAAYVQAYVRLDGDGVVRFCQAGVAAKSPTEGFVDWMENQGKQGN